MQKRRLLLDSAPIIGQEAAMTRALMFVCLGSMIFCGCGNDRSRTPLTDAGMGDVASSDAAADSLPDSSSDSTGGDGGSGDRANPDAAPMCADAPLPPWTMGRVCPMSMKACVDACPNSACVDAYLDDGDPSSACSFCQQVQLISCINRNGCDPLWDCYRTCVTSNCPGGEGTCIDANCADEENAYGDCSTGEGVLELCGTRNLDCLPE